MMTPLEKPMAIGALVRLYRGCPTFQALQVGHKPFSVFLVVDWLCIFPVYDLRMLAFSSSLFVQAVLRPGLAYCNDKARSCAGSSQLHPKCRTRLEEAKCASRSRLPPHTLLASSPG